MSLLTSATETHRHPAEKQIDHIYKLFESARRFDTCVTFLTRKLYDREEWDTKISWGPLLDDVKDLRTQLTTVMEVDANCFNFTGIDILVSDLQWIQDRIEIALLEEWTMRNRRFSTVAILQKGTLRHGTIGRLLEFLRTKKLTDTEPLVKVTIPQKKEMPVSNTIPSHNQGSEHGNKKKKPKHIGSLNELAGKDKNASFGKLWEMLKTEMKALPKTSEPESKETPGINTEALEKMSDFEIEENQREESTIAEEKLREKEQKHLSITDLLMVEEKDLLRTRNAFGFLPLPCVVVGTTKVKTLKRWKKEHGIRAMTLLGTMTAFQDAVVVGVKLNKMISELGTVKTDRQSMQRVVESLQKHYGMHPLYDAEKDLLELTYELSPKAQSKLERKRRLPQDVEGDFWKRSKVIYNSLVEFGFKQDAALWRRLTYMNNEWVPAVAGKRIGDHVYTMLLPAREAEKFGGNRAWELITKPL